MPRKTHGKKDADDARARLLAEVAELARRLEEAVGAVVTRPEWREAVDELAASVRGATRKLGEAAAAARHSPEGEAVKAQAEKVAASGRDAGAALAKGLAAGLKTLAEELEGIAGRARGKKGR